MGSHAVAGEFAPLTKTAPEGHLWVSLQAIVCTGPHRATLMGLYWVLSWLRVSPWWGTPSRSGVSTANVSLGMTQGRPFLSNQRRHSLHGFYLCPVEVIHFQEQLRRIQVFSNSPP